MDRNFEENVARSFNLVKKDINKLYSLIEDMKLKLEKPKTKKVKKKRKKAKK